jgi:squalene-associated FAD-dependent desaturase
VTQDVVVVGGGLAGIAAALRCADAGRTVTLLEAKPRLGGLTYSFRRGDLDVDNGQHVFLRCCTAYRALLARLGVGEQVHLQDRLDIPVRPLTGRAARLRRTGLPAPLHLGAALLRYGPLTPAQRLRFVRAALAMRKVDRADPAVDAVSFGAWLRGQGQDARTVDALWDLVGVATLNARADDAALSLAAMVFQVGLLTDRGAADIGWSRVPLQRLHGDAAAASLAAAGVTVRTGAKVTRVEPRDGGWAVDDVATDQVVLATTPRAAEALAPADAVVAPAGWAAGLGAAPIVNVHVVLDRRVLAEPFVAAVGSPIQWVFDRTVPSGLTSGQYLAVSLSAADAYVDLPVAALRERLLPELATLLPGLRAATVTDFFVTREREATFRPQPGSQALRAPTETRAAGLFLAGAWTDTGWPATMEGAVRSGDAAARAVLARPARRGVAA